MRFLAWILSHVCALSIRFPRTVVVFFLAVGIAGFSTMPLLRMSTNLLAGIGENNPIIKLTQENNTLFGEQDSLIVVLKFPEPPGDDRLPFIRKLGEGISHVQGIRRVRWQYVDPDDSEQVAFLLNQFLLGMNARERQRMAGLFTPEGFSEALRRNRNRLFLAENPYLRQRLLEDPLEIANFVSESMHTRVGDVSLGDVYLLIASPDSTTYLIQVTPAFPSTDLVQAKTLIESLRKEIPRIIAELRTSMPGMNSDAADLQWSLTGKTVFHHESDVIFDRESTTILVFSSTAVMLLLLIAYRSPFSMLVLMTPIISGIGSSYGVIYLSYAEVNPVVMGAVGVLFGLGTDYGVHLWGRMREELDRGADPVGAALTVYEQIGPAVMAGALTSILAFLCLCLSDQPAMAQFGWVGASGMVLTLVATIFMFPALVRLLNGSSPDRYPRMRLTFGFLAHRFEKWPRLIVAVSAVVLAVSLVFASRVTYEKDLFKVFLADNMESMNVSNRISKKFNSNFTQPTLLSFDCDDYQKGLSIQRSLDAILEGFMSVDGELSSFDSISYLVSPDAVQRTNREFLRGIVGRWPELRHAFLERLDATDLTETASAVMRRSFDGVGALVDGIVSGRSAGAQERAGLERSWYTANVGKNYRFLTLVRYAAGISEPEQLKKLDRKILVAVKVLPVPVQISGPRQAMEQLLSSLISELVKLGLYVLVATLIFFSLLFRHPLGVVLSLIPMAGAFVFALAVMGVLGVGLPFSIVGVAPLIFGLGMDNGVHVVTGSSPEEGGSVSAAMDRVTRPIVFTSLANLMGFVAMIISRHYSLQFLGWAMVIGMTAAVTLTLTTLPAILLLRERRNATAGGGEAPSSAGRQEISA